MATTSNTKSVTGSSGTYDSGSFLKQTWSETTAAGANTYAINADATSAKLSLRGSGDAIYVNGLSGEYQVKASGKTVTLKSDSQTITIVLNSVSKTTVVANTIYFVDGSLTLGNSSGSTALKLGSQSLSSKLKVISAEVTDSSTAAAYFDGTSSNTSGVTLEDGIKTNDGTSGDDVWEGDTMGGASATLEDGDTINGYAGNDTLNIKAKGDSATFVMNSVETVNVELWSAQSYDMARWSGVQTVNITNNSTDDSLLTLTNAVYDTTFKVSDDADFDVTYKTGLTTGTVKLAVNGAGVSAGDTAAITVNGAQQAVSLTASGASFVTLDASAEAVTVVGQGSITLLDSDVVSSLSYAGFSGTTTTTLDAESNLVFTGGAGNDTLTITGLTSADTLTGGVGTDTLIATYGTSTVLQGVSGFEVAKLSLTEASTVVGLSGSPFTTFEVKGISAATDLSISGIASNVSINLNAATAADTLQLGYASGATAVITSKASGAGGFSGPTTISGASTVTLSMAGASATQTFSGLSVTHAGTVNLAAGGSGTLDVNGVVTLTHATTLNATVSGEASLTGDADIVASGLTSISVANAGSSSTSLWLGKGAGADAFSLNSGSHTIVADAGIADLELGSVTVGDGANDTITLTVGNGGRLNSAGGFAYVASSGTVALNVTQGTSSLANLDSINAGTSGTISAYNVTAGLSGVFSAGNITAKTMSGLSVTGAQEASATVGNLAIGGSLGNITLTQGGSGSTILGSIDAGTGIGNITVSGADASTITLGALSAETIGNLSGVVGSAGTLTFTTLVADSGTFGSITMAGGSGSTITLGSISASDSASATDTVGAITLTGSGQVDSTLIYASASVGALSVADGVNGTFTQIVSKAMGNITVSGDAFTISKVSATTVGNISLAGSANSITLGGTLTTVGTVTITGSGAQAVNLASASTVGTINILGASGNTLTLSNVKNAVTVNLGTGTNTVYLGTGGATINATAATGNDKLYLAGSANDGITVSNFELLGSGGDSINLSTAGFSFGFASATSFGSAVGGEALSVVVANSAGTTVQFASAASQANTDVFVLATGSYTSITGAMATLGTLVSAAQAGAAAAAGSDILVLWYDSLSDSTKLTLVNATAGTMQKTFTSTFNGDTNTLVTFSGIDIRGASGDFSDMFKAY